ncbi:hypothetical protein EW145_g1789 [Phellinidium pouzarii]|uniref:Uncharacterized protein n=1 Tax=Phellinidium pouzarii TaxID=167371 RepID=A0A4S4LIR7_9AGAM|nr:hypothetical protein EW145_g1789 [Phellinidium pouzarii]
MSTHSNPYVQGGWYGASSFTLGPDQNADPPSAYGALPMLNTTDASDENLAGYTAFRDAEGRSIALIEWTARPAVEVRGAVVKSSASEWVKVEQDPIFGRPVRRMEVRGAKFVWCPNGEALLLFTQAPSSIPLVVVTKQKHVVDLEMSEQALARGLLEPCIVAVTLLLSGRRLE